MNIQAMAPPCNTLIYIKPFFSFLFVHLPLFLGLELNLSSFLGSQVLWHYPSLIVLLVHVMLNFWPFILRFLLWFFSSYCYYLFIEVNASAHPKITSTNTSLSPKIAMICVNLLCFLYDYKCLLIVVHMLMVIMVILFLIST